MASFRQTSFLSGELSPLLWGRTDLELYQRGLRRCRNFFITKQGIAKSRPGTRLVAKTKTQGGTTRAVRLVPFVYSDSESYVLEFGDRYMRLHQNGAPVLVASTPYEITTPWKADEIRQLKFVQSGNVLFVVHKNHPLTKLTRLAHTNWSTLPVDFTSTEIVSGGTHIQPVWVDRDPGIFPPGFIPQREWTYQVTYVLRRSDGTVFETSPVTVDIAVNHSPATESDLTSGSKRKPLARKLRIQPDLPGLIYVCLESNVLDPADLVEVRIYRGRGNLYGLIGIVQPPANTMRGIIFEDPGDLPDFTRQPPKNVYPFGVRAGVQGRPSAVTFFEQRLVVGGTGLDPSKAWFSKVDSYFNFDEIKPTPPADASGSFTLALRRKEDIRAFVALDQLLVFTESSVWSVGGMEGTLDAGGLLDIQQQVDVGASYLQPLVVGKRALWVRTKGSGVRDLGYDWQSRGYVGQDLSMISEHLFASREVVDWTYAEDPYSIVWAVGSDGKLLSLTYGDGASAWAWHDSPDGIFESICSVPEGGEDAVYVVVRRGGSRYVERFASRKDGMCLDCGRSTTFNRSGTTTVTVTGLDHLNGRVDVYGVAGGLVQGPFTVVGGAVTLQTPPGSGLDSAHAGLRFTPELETLDTPEARDNPKVVRKVVWEVNETKGLWTGETFDELVEWQQRDVAAGYGPVLETTDRVEMTIGSSWNLHGRAVLRQVDPLPITVLGVMREGDVGGR